MKQNEPDVVVAILGVLALAAGFGESKRRPSRNRAGASTRLYRSWKRIWKECNAAIAKR